MKVLLTRRLADSERTAAKLVANGFEPVIFPLFGIEPSGKPQPHIRPDFLVFTSAAALEVLAAAGSKMPFTELPCYCVGPHTMAELVAKGYKDVRQGEGTAGDLAGLISRDFANTSARGLYICGAVRAFDLAGELEKSGLGLFLWEVYRICEPEVPNERFSAILDDLNTGIITFFSPKSVERFFALLAGIGGGERIGECHLLAISQNCAARIPVEWQAQVRIAESPDEDGMIKAMLKLSERDHQNV